MEYMNLIVMCVCLLCVSVVQSVCVIRDHSSRDAAQYRLQALSVWSANQLIPGSPESPRQPRWLNWLLILCRFSMVWTTQTLSLVCLLLPLRPARGGAGHRRARPNTSLCWSPGWTSERKSTSSERWPLHPSYCRAHTGDGQQSEGHGPLLLSGRRLSVQLADMSWRRYAHILTPDMTHSPALHPNLKL